MKTLENRIPPPLVGLVCAIAMWGLARATPAFAMPSALRLALAAGCALLGIGIAVAGVAAFRRARTTVNPLKPDTATHLVVGGLNRVSRNPMYVGQALLLAAWALWLAHALAPLGAVAFVLYITRFQILPEERALAARFGDDWRAYRARVRRWL